MVRWFEIFYVLQEVFLLSYLIVSYIIHLQTKFFANFCFLFEYFAKKIPKFCQKCKMFHVAVTFHFNLVFPTFSKVLESKLLFEQKVLSTWSACHKQPKVISHWLAFHVRSSVCQCSQKYRKSLINKMDIMRANKEEGRQKRKWMK